MNPEKAFYTIEEFANLLNMSYRTIYNAVKSGRVNAFRITDMEKASYRIPASEIHRIAEMDFNKKRSES